MSDKDAPYTKDKPFPAPMLKLYNLNKEGTIKETIHAEISLEGSGLTYQPGDALGVWALNATDLIDEFLGATGLGADETVTIGEASMSFGEALSAKLDLRVVSKIVLTKYAKAAGNDELLEKCGDREWVKDYSWGRDWVDVVKDYPSDSVTEADFVGFLRPMSPRLYSIASSIAAHPNEVHLTVAAVRYEAQGRQKKGVASTFIADMWPVGETAGIYFHNNKKFKLPENPDTPIIMVGPGTGIAPFRAFLEERVATGAKGKSWLFFGDQHEATDYLYEEQWKGYLEAGQLDRIDLAFSRDQDFKIYVQDRMRENAAELYRWISEGAYFYVCGDASRMAKDVHQALLDTIAEHGNMSEEDAAAYVKAMQKEGRYARDVY